MNRCAVGRRVALGLFVACVLSAALPASIAMAEAVFPLASRIGLVPPAGLKASHTFSGFEDRQNSVFIRLISLPGKAFAEIEKNMTNDALRKQGVSLDQREAFALAAGKAILLTARQRTNSGPIRKWLLIASLGDITALVSFEVPNKSVAHYPEKAIRRALASVTVRASVPVDEKLALLPFKMTEMAGLRLVRVVPGVAIQLTEGPKDTLEALEQAHLVISIAPGGPRRTSDRDTFARAALSGLPPLKAVHIVSAEPMRIEGQPGYEIRAEAKAPKDGTDIQIVQWLRFGAGAYIRILGIAPKQNWTETFMRFRSVRDGLAPR
jgi:hypothetical protein